MCFTAGASFTASAVLATTGIATLREVHSKRELPLALVPAIFSIHQFTEGVIWLTIGKEQWRSLQHWLTFGFLLVAYGLWPVLSPAAFYLIEPDKDKQKRFVPLLILGAGTSLYLLYYMLAGSFQASIVNCSIY